MENSNIGFKKVRFFQLEKQNLLSKADASEYSLILKEHLGLHSTDYLTPYISLWARIKDFNPEALFDDLSVHRTALRMRAFRSTVFVVHKDNLKRINNALRYCFISENEQGLKKLVKKGVDYEKIEKKAIDALKGGISLKAGELRQRLGEDLNDEQFNLALRFFEHNGVLARTAQSNIMDRNIKYGLLKEWVPDIELNDIDQEKALEELLLEYIRKFGPVCVDDICWWLPIQKAPVRKALESIKELTVTLDFNAREYIMEKEDYKRLSQYESYEDREPIVNFLPYEDHFPKAYTVRNWFLSEETSPLVFQVKKTELGQLRPSIWLNGEIIGRWELEWGQKSKSAVEVKIIDINEKIKLSKKEIELVEEKRAELEIYITKKVIPLMGKAKK